MIRKIFVGCFSLIVLAVVILAVFFVIDTRPWERAAPEQIDQLARSYLDIAKLRGKFPELKGLTEKKCPADPALQSQNLPIIHETDLERFASPDSPQWDNEEWEWVMNSEMNGFNSPLRTPGKWAAQNSLERIEKIKSRNYLVVFKDTSLAQPEALDRYGNFIPGVLKGWLAVMEISSARPICWVSLEARNREKVNYIKKHAWTTATHKRRLNRALKSDLHKAFHARAEEALARISGKPKTGF